VHRGLSVDALSAGLAFGTSLLGVHDIRVKSSAVAGPAQQSTARRSSFTDDRAIDALSVIGGGA
jgi:hypothetical protein